MSRKRKIGLCATVSVFLILSFFFLTSDVFTVKPNQAAIDKAIREKAEVAAIDKTRLTTFRNTYWGMTTAQVKAVEEWPFADLPQPDDFLIYEGTLFEVPCQLVYVLRAETPNPTLNHAAYYFRESEKVDPVKLTILFLQADKYLTFIYGPHVDFKKHGFKDKEMTTTWRSKDTEITLSYDPGYNPQYPWIKSPESVAIDYRAIKSPLRAQN